MRDRSLRCSGSDSAGPSPACYWLIPADNEERRIEPVLRDYARYFPAVSLLDFPEPIGKGGALTEGLRLASRAEAIGYVDADEATPPAGFHDPVKRLGEADCVIGSRWLPGAVLHQSQSGKRQFARRVLHAIVQGLFWMNNWLRPLCPLEGWVYLKLHAAQPLPGPGLHRSAKPEVRNPKP